MPNKPTASEAERSGMPWMSSNLRLRLISGSVLAITAFVMTYAGLLTFAALVLVCALVISWEWGRLVRGTTYDLGFYVQAFAVTVAIVLATAGYATLGIAALVIGAITLVPPYFGRGARLSALGVLYVGLPAVALLWLRSDVTFGFLAVLFIFAVVWSSDTAAFAAGRGIGGPKLWPRVSPNKTWAGLVGALCAGAVSGAVFAALVPGGGVVRLVSVGLGLALVAQAGDLAESALKRLFHLKDASDLIPGHGGFMDRMDSMVAAAVVSALFALAIAPHAPARALMLGF